MNQAQEILKMIEEVDPSDETKMDEIDLSVAKYLKQHKIWIGIVTRSRDALKAIRPDGWFGMIRFFGEYSVCNINHVHPFGNADSQHLPTEELAELHAIIQAIEYERSK